MVKNGLHIALTEPVVFLRGPVTGEDHRGRRPAVRDDVPPALLRGLLSLNLSKPSRIKKIEITLEGKTRTEWPEGIGSRRTETHEEHTIFEATTTYFSSDRSTSRVRRATSIGPGIVGDGGDSNEEDDHQPRRGRAAVADHREPLEGGDLAGETVAGVTGRLHALTAGNGNGNHRYSSFLSSGDGLDERGRGRDPRNPRSASMMPSYSTTAPHSRRTSFDADSIPGGGGALDGLTGALASNRRPAYMTRFAMEDGGVHPRGPSPAYTPQASAHNSPNTHLVGLPEDEALHPTTRAQPPLPSPLHGVLSPIQSATTSQAASRESSAGGIGTSSSLADTPHPGAGESPYLTANGQRPVRHPIVNTQSFASVDITDPSSSNVSSDANDSDAQTLPRPWTSSHSQPQSMASSAVSSAASSIRDAPGVIGGNGADHHPELAPPSTASRTTTVGASNSTPSSPSLRPASALPSLNGGSESAHSSTVRFGREASPLPSLSRGRTPPARTESQTRSRSRFSLGSALRGISQDLKDRLPLGSSSHHHKDGAGAGGSSSSHRHRSVTPRPEDDELIAPYGRGGVGAVTSRGRRKSPTRNDLANEREESRSREAGSRSASRQRGRAAGMKLLTGAVGVGGDDDDGDDAAGWKEFRKGAYHYPISFTIPVTTPPTIHADFGSVTYRLKAVVHRAGALTSNLTDEKEVWMVACPGVDDMDETENIIVERQWEEQLRYLVALSGKSFPIGGQIPISLRLMPLDKAKIYRISVLMEEKIDYYAHDKKVARHEATRRYQLLSLKSPSTTAPKAVPLLPIISDSEDALLNSPLRPLTLAALENGGGEDGIDGSLFNPTGPWLLDHMLQVPDCGAKIHFSTKHANTNMSIAHWLKVVFRVERGEPESTDPKAKRKQFDIIIETPITLLDCRCNLQFTSLPSYAVLAAGLPANSSISTCTCKTSAEQASHRAALSSKLPPVASTLIGHAGSSSGSGSGSGMGGLGPGGMPGMGAVPSPNQVRHGSPGGRHLMEDTETVQERSDHFARLVSGQETSTGDVPPSYDAVLTGDATGIQPAGTTVVREARSASRGPGGAGSASRSRSRVPIGGGGSSASRTTSPLPLHRVGRQNN